jgi:hypothetical protein
VPDAQALTPAALVGPSLPPTATDPRRKVFAGPVDSATSRLSWGRPSATTEVAVKYILLIHQGSTPTPRSPEDWGRLSQEEQREIFAAYRQVSETPGVTPGVELQPPEMATTVRVEDGRTLTTDGPFVELKEAIGGYLLFEADDLDAATELAARIPAARLGGAIEVRPVVER